MKENNFVTLSQVYRASAMWYDKSDRDSLCLAECRLMRGEKPSEDFYENNKTK